MLTVNIFRGKHGDNPYSIVSMENGTVGILSFGDDDPPLKLHTVYSKENGGWEKLGRRSKPILFTPNLVSQEGVDFAPILESWKKVPVYELSSPILKGLYSNRIGALEAMFGVKLIIRPRIDLGTDRVVTRPGTFRVEDLVSVGIGRGLIKALLTAEVFHIPKS